MADKSYNSILLVRLRAVGEVVMTLPVVDIVRRNYPDAHLAMMVESPCDEIFVADERVDSVLVFDKPYLRSLPYHRRMKEFWSFVGKLRRYKFDLAIDLHNVSRSQWLTFLSGAKERVGLHTDAVTCHLHNKVLEIPKEQKQHNITRYIQILKQIGMSVDECTYELRLAQESKKWVEHWLESQQRNRKRLIAIHPGAAHMHKCWPPEKFARVGDMLCEGADADILVTAGPQEGALVKQVRGAMKNPSLCADNLSLQQLACLLHRCDLTISNDTGPTHISSAVGTPTIAVIGPTNPYISGPAAASSAIVWAERYCSPCYRNMFSCPLRKCFEMVTPEDVFKKAMEMLTQEEPVENQGTVSRTIAKKVYHKPIFP